MKIAIVHSFYSSDVPSGENVAVREQVATLRERGHEVLVVARHTDYDKQQSLYKLKSGLRQVTGWGSDPLGQLRAFSPEVVHVHNLFPNIGTTWLDRWTGPIVHTLHNFRAVCSNGLLFRDGAPCRECVERSSFMAVKHGCYRNSRMASLPLALGASRGMRFSPLVQRAEALVCLSWAAFHQFQVLGAPRGKLKVIPNGLRAPDVKDIDNNFGPWVFAGRLSPEKGISQLLKMWPEHEPLEIIGGGPEENEIRRLARENVCISGPLPRSRTLQSISSARGLVLPTLCFEMQPTVVVEALALGVPVIAFEGNSIASLVNQMGVGMTYANRNDLEGALAKVAYGRAGFSNRALEAYERHFSVGSWTEKITNLYTELSLT